MPSLPCEVLRVLDSLRGERYTDARNLHIRADEQFWIAGFSTRREVPVELPDRLGHVDLVIARDGYNVGLELDDRSPRAKSVQKLVNGDFDYRVVVLRRGGSGRRRAVAGIDLVFGVG